MRYESSTPHSVAYILNRCNDIEPRGLGLTLNHWCQVLWILKLQKARKCHVRQSKHLWFLSKTKPKLVILHHRWWLRLSLIVVRSKRLSPRRNNWEEQLLYSFRTHVYSLKLSSTHTAFQRHRLIIPRSMPKHNTDNKHPVYAVWAKYLDTKTYDCALKDFWGTTQHTMHPGVNVSLMLFGCENRDTAKPEVPDQYSRYGRTDRSAKT